MTPAETVDLVEMAMSMCPQQAINEKTPDAWHLLLHDLDARQALEALVALAKKQPFVSPAEIRREAAAIQTRNARILEGSTPTADLAGINPPPGLSEPEYRRWLGESRRALARGETPRSHEPAGAVPAPPWFRQLEARPVPD